MASRVNLGCRGRGYKLYIFESWRKGSYFGGPRGTLLLLLYYNLQAIYGHIVLIRNVSIFSFSVGFSDNQWLLKSVLGPGL